MAGVGPTTSILQQLTQTLPIVFAQTIDPVGNGFIERMSRPGGNITGLTQFEYVLSAKWLELLNSGSRKEQPPRESLTGKQWR